MVGSHFHKFRRNQCSHAEVCPCWKFKRHQHLEQGRENPQDQNLNIIFIMSGQVRHGDQPCFGTYFRCNVGPSLTIHFGWIVEHCSCHTWILDSIDRRHQQLETCLESKSVSPQCPCQSSHNIVLPPLYHSFVDSKESRKIKFSPKIR